MDTDTLLAIVSSLLNPSLPQQDQCTLLSALVQCDGDAQAAAQMLNRDAREGKPGKGKMKRKRRVDLDGWLVRDLQEKGCSLPRKRVGETEGSPPPMKRPRGTEVASPAAERARSQQPNSPGSPVDLMSILRQAPTLPRKLPRRGPLTLSTPSLVAKHVPCTLHPSVLPAELACKLFWGMVREGKEWGRNKWWLFDRLVESPHRTCFYRRSAEDKEGATEAAQYWYNGRPTTTPPLFPPEMEEACEIIEDLVNNELSKRPPLSPDLQWDQRWRANVAVANCYEGAAEGVGYHSDALTYLGPYPTIASLSLGTKRVFRLREVLPEKEEGARQPQVFDIPLTHNSLTMMHASCQEKYKHTVPPQPTLDLFHPPFPPSPAPSPLSSTSNVPSTNIRINITFRFYRPDFHPSSIPRCHCGVPTTLRHDMRERGGKRERYWWVCAAGAQREGKGCAFWREMDMAREGRGTRGVT